MRKPLSTSWLHQPLSEGWLPRQFEETDNNNSLCPEGLLGVHRPCGIPGQEAVQGNCSSERWCDFTGDASPRCPISASHPAPTPEVETTLAHETPGKLMKGTVLSGSKRNQDFKNQRPLSRFPSGLASVTVRHNLPLSSISRLRWSWASSGPVWYFCGLWVY